MAMLPLHPDTIHDELVSVRVLVDKWIKKVIDGIPGVDPQAPSSPEALDAYLRELVGELYLSSSKLQGLANVLNEQR